MNTRTGPFPVHLRYFRKCRACHQVLESGHYREYHPWHRPTAQVRHTKQRAIAEALAECEALEHKP